MYNAIYRPAQCATLSQFLNKSALDIETESLLHLRYAILKSGMQYKAGEFKDYQILYLDYNYTILQAQQILTCFFKNSYMIARDTEFVEDANPNKNKCKLCYI